MKMMTNETKKGAHAMIVRRLDDGNATSLTWLKSREERYAMSMPTLMMMMNVALGREEKRRDAALDVGGPG